MSIAAVTDRDPAQRLLARRSAGSVAGALFAGHLPIRSLLNRPVHDPPERDRVESLARTFNEYAAESFDPALTEERGWIGDDFVRDLADLNLMGLGVPETWGGQGLSTTGYCRMFEAFGRVDIGTALVLGIHQSIGTRGIVEYGMPQQQERFLPDLAAARRLAAFALTEPSAGSDAYNIRTRAVRQADGSWRLNGEKCYIGNAHTADVFVTFARAEVAGRDRHVALIVERGMPGFEAGPRIRTMGLRANVVGPLYFHDVRVPADNVLGEPGDGYRIATRILENGRLTIAAGVVGCIKQLLELTLSRTSERWAFGRRLASFELVQQKIAWMRTQLAAIEAMTYLTTSLEDEARLECVMEAALCKILATDAAVGVANRALDLRGGGGYECTQPYERILRDVRVFPIFEGSNDVLRPWVAMLGIRAMLNHTQETLGEQAGRAVTDSRMRRVAEHSAALAAGARECLTRHGEGIAERQLMLARMSAAIGEIYAQAAIAAMARTGADSADLAADAFLAGSDRRLDSLLPNLEDEGDAEVAAVALAAVQGGGLPGAGRTPVGRSQRG